MTFSNYKILVQTVHIRNYDNQNNHNNITAMFKDFPHDVKNENFFFFFQNKSKRFNFFNNYLT